jgi:RND family efflux transporter MFP subunit
MASEDLSKLKIDKAAPVSRPGRRRSPGKWIAAAALIGLAAFLFYKFVLNPAIEVEVATVSKFYPSEGFTLLNASGYVVAQRKASVSSKATGRLEWLGVEEGSKVKTGEVIARLEDRDVIASREQAAANLNNARAALRQAQAESDDASLNLDRMKELLARDFVPQNDYDTAEARYKRAQAAVTGAEAAIKAAQAALEGAAVAVEYTRIRSPFDAVVLTKDADVGDIITPFGSAANAKAAVVTIADLSSLQVEADVSESNLEKVKMGQPCEIQLDAVPDTRFPGVVHMIVPTADRTKASVMVKVKFRDLDKRVLPEMSARVAFLDRPVSPAEENPRTGVNPGALVTRKGKQLVFLVKGSTVQEVAVRTGEKRGDMVEILEGIQAGDRVVVNPPQKLRDGLGITIKEQ